MTQNQTTSDQEMSLPDDLVRVDWLADQLGDPEVRVVDIRGYVTTENLGGGRQQGTYTAAREEYDAGRIPGAVFVDWTTDIVDPDADVKAQIARPEQFRLAMEERGISDDTFVVVADHIGGHLATRLWWALRYFGHDAVAVLEGGYGAWNAAGLPMSTDVPVIESGKEFTPNPRPELRSDVEEVLRQVQTATGQIIDARDPATFHGETQRGSRGGHIPGAVNLPAKSLMNDDGSWKSPKDIRSLAQQAGVDISQPATMYCNGGVTATQLMFGLRRAGMTGLTNYDGSWNEWGEREDLPVENNRDLFGKGEPE